MTDTLERREAIARVIDPKSWAIHDSWAAWLRGEGERPDDAEQCAMMRRSYERRMPGLVAASLAKADKIAALTTSPRVDEGRAREVEIGREALRYVLNFATERTQVRTVMNCFTLPDRVTVRERLESLYTALATTPADPRAGEEPWAWGWYELGGTKRAYPYLPTVDYPREPECDPFPLYRAADPRVGKMEADLEVAKIALDKAAHRFDHCATMIGSGFDIPGTRRMEQVLKAQAFALEARSTLSQIEGSGR